MPPVSATSTSLVGTVREGKAAGAVSALGERLEAVQAELADAAHAAGREPAEITLIAVTKFHPASLVRELAALGQCDFGENRHQEAQIKARELSQLRVAGEPLRWHFIGQLQSNKARQVRRYAHAVHSVDRPGLVDALARVDEDAQEATPAASLGIFLQLSLDGAPGRGGVSEDALEPLAERVLKAPGLTLLGLMAVAPLGAPPGPAFERLAAASARLQRLSPRACAISAGMSGDFREAIAHGATHLRIGTAITGSRPQTR